MRIASPAFFCFPFAWCFSPCVYPVWDSLHLLDLIDYFLFPIGKIFYYNLFKIFLIPFLFLFFFRDRYNSNVGTFDFVPEVSETSLSSFHSFYCILLFSSYFHHFIFQLTDLFFASDILLRIPSATAATAKSLRSCPTLCDPMHCSPPGSPVPGILQARTLEWVVISFSNA